MVRLTLFLVCHALLPEISPTALETNFELKPILVRLTLLLVCHALLWSETRRHMSKPAITHDVGKARSALFSVRLAEEEISLEWLFSVHD